MTRIALLAGVFTAILTGCASDDAPGPAPVPGSMTVTVTSTGPTLDADGYYLAVASYTPERIARDGQLTLTDLPPGEYRVLLFDLAPLCSADSNPLTVTVGPGEMAQVSLKVDCRAGCDPLGGDCLRLPAGSSNGAGLKVLAGNRRAAPSPPLPKARP